MRPYRWHRTPPHACVQSWPELRTVLEELGLTFAELIRRTGFPAWRFYQLTRGTRQPTPEEIRRVADVLGVPASRLLTAPPARRRTLAELLTEEA